MNDLEKARAGKRPILAASSLPDGAALLSEPPIDQVFPRGTFSCCTPKWLLVRALGAIISAFAVMIWCLIATLSLVTDGVLGGQWWRLCAGWLAVEVAFAVWYIQWHVPKFNQQPQPHRPKAVDSVLHFKRVLAHARFYTGLCGHEINWRDYLSTWFLGANLESIRLGNLLEMLAYGFYYSKKSEMKEAGKWRELQSLVAHFLETSKLQLAHGYNTDLRFMAHLHEPLRWTYRPLAFYCLTEAISLATGAGMLAMGYRRSTALCGMTYYSFSGLPPMKQQTPILFLHGVGLGLLPYLLLISQLTASGLPVVCPEIKHVSMRLCSYIPTACEMAEKVVAVLSTLGMGQVSIVAHSYGTFVASRLVQAHRQETVHSLTLIDPVCFGMFLPQLLHNFIYRTPYDVYKLSGLCAAAKASFVWLISRDVHCAATFCRRFYWTDCNLWAEELPEKCLIVLAGQDELLHAEEIRQVATRGYRGLRRSPKCSPQELIEQQWQQTALPPPLLASLSPSMEPALMLSRKLTPSYLPPVPISTTNNGNLGSSISSSPIFESLHEGEEEMEHTEEQGEGSSSSCGSGGSGSASHGLQPCSNSEDDETAYEEQPVPDTVRVLFQPSAAHADFLIDPIWTAEIVEQVKVLASSNETAKLHVQRRATAAHLVAAANPTSHRAAAKTRTKTFSAGMTMVNFPPSDKAASDSSPTDPSCSQAQAEAAPHPMLSSQLYRAAGCAGSGDILRMPRTHTVQPRSISDVVTALESVQDQVGELKSLLTASNKVEQPQLQQPHPDQHVAQQAASGLVKRKATRVVSDQGFCSRI